MRWIEVTPLELRQIQDFMKVAKRGHGTEKATAIHFAQSVESGGEHYLHIVL